MAKAEIIWVTKWIMRILDYNPCNKNINPWEKKILFSYATKQRILLTLDDFLCSMNPERNN